MKKIFLLVFGIFASFISLNSVYAANKIESIDISVYIDELGDASITEVWSVDGSDGTEWYKVINNLGNSKLSDFTVSMDGNPLTYKNWNVNESLTAKKGYYGIIDKSNGYELCFGKYDYNKHIFTLKYKLSNFIFNTSDAQVIYFNFIDKLDSVNFKNFTLEISSYYEFPDTLDVWGYGYKGYAYVENGKIKMSNASSMDDKYVVLLAKFPVNTFNTDNSYSQFKTFNDVYDKAEENTFEYNYNSDKFIELIALAFIYFIMPILIILFVSNLRKNTKYGFKDNKKIDKNTPYYRDIPCNKDIYYANTLASLNGWVKKDTNILGAVLLKWIKIGKIIIEKEEKSFNRETTSLRLVESPFNDYYEETLFKYMYEASHDGVLEAKELERWANINSEKFLKLFDSISSSKISDFKQEGHIYKRTYKKECKYKNVMDDTLYEESKKLYGFKLFLEHFSNINEREAIEVNLWDEYLMFAYIFGIADKVAKQFKNLYPEIIEQLNETNFDFDTFIFLNNISNRSINVANAAEAARRAAESYSSGGGGFSSGGGGGGSFGGGGGGSR